MAEACEAGEAEACEAEACVAEAREAEAPACRHVTHVDRRIVLSTAVSTVLLSCRPSYRPSCRGDLNEMGN